jgi:hypothetical protein
MGFPTFNLTESRKRKISHSTTDTLNDSYHSTAEKIRAFEKQKMQGSQNVTATDDFAVYFHIFAG